VEMFDIYMGTSRLNQRNEIAFGLSVHIVYIKYWWFQNRC